MSKQEGRQERWERDLPELTSSIFPPRICKDLSNIDIEIQSKDIVTIVQDQQGLFIFGETGTGKTLYAAALLLECIYYFRKNRQGNPTAAFVTSLELLEQIKRTFQDKENTENKGDPALFYNEVNLLIIDDIGIEKISDWVLQTLNYIVNSRYEYLRPTVITSNFDLGQLQKHLGSRTISRIQEMTKQKHFNGRNYRLEKEG